MKLNELIIVSKSKQEPVDWDEWDAQLIADHKAGMFAAAEAAAIAEDESDETEEL